MADDVKLEARVLTPEGEIFKGELFQLSTRTAVGDIGVRARHAPLVARVVPAELRLHETSSAEPEQTFAQGEGWLEIFANRATLLIAEAHPPDALEAGELRERIDEAKRKLDEAEGGSAASEAATRELVRAEAFLAIAESR